MEKERSSSKEAEVAEQKKEFEENWEGGDADKKGEVEHKFVSWKHLHGLISRETAGCFFASKSKLLHIQSS